MAAPSTQTQIDLTDSDDDDLFGDRFVTQPTQPLSTPLHIRRQSPPPVVQVRASSPLASQYSPGPPAPYSGPRTAPIQRGAFNGGVLAHSFAPPGTEFRPVATHSQSQPHSQAAGRSLSQSQAYHQAHEDFSGDDGRVSDSSEDELAPRSADIKPSILLKNGKPLVGVDHGGDRVRAHFQQYLHTGSMIPQKRAPDTLADAYASSSRSARPFKIARQEPAAVLDDLKIGDLDWEYQKPVEEIMEYCHGATVRQCYDACRKCHSIVTSAASMVMDQIEKQKNAIDLTSSDKDEIKKSEAALAPARSFKRPGTKANPTVKRDTSNTKTIAQKWSTTATQSSERVVNELLGIRQAPKAVMMSSSSPPLAPCPAPEAPMTPPQPIRRRLVQGRKHPSSPVQPESEPVLNNAKPPPPATVPVRRKVIDSDDEAIAIESDDDDDSGVEVDAPSDALEDRLLKFINTCTTLELIDVSSQPLDIVEHVIAQRPYRTMNDVRAITTAYTTTTRTGKNVTRQKQIGERLVDVCLEMYQGYEAVDELVYKCEQLGKPIAEELKQWGLDAFGSSSSQGELQMTDFESSHDSGIGTPTSSIVDGTDPRRKKLQQPAIMASDLEMKDYQIVGLNWLTLLFSKQLSCILADDMGLGKTCQVIAFVSHLYEINIKGPHLVVVPGSTLENWLREFKKFSPSLRVEPYYGSQNERAEQRLSIEEEIDDINVIVTTYDMAQKKMDSHFLRHMKWVACVYDEGHMLKNSESQRYKELMRIPAQFRLLLTGTPLQNNLQELVSLLAFIMPTIFRERQEQLQYIFKHKAKTTDSENSALLSTQRISRARSMMTPFILRRKKHQVLKHLPAKTCRVEYCELTPNQRVLYDEQLAEVKAALLARTLEKEKKTTKTAANAGAKASMNKLMDLRKAAIHPLLFRRYYTDSVLRDMAELFCSEHPESTVELVVEDYSVMSDYELDYFCHERSSFHPYTLDALTEYDEDTDEPPAYLLDSGKVTALLRIIRKYIENGDRCLVFSQFTSVLNILEALFNHHTVAIPYSRLDGGTPISSRQELIDQFHADTSIPVFMLSTKAGGAGINLECANKVIIFDGSFNPQEDVQAENRAHRVRQTREVEVVRLVGKGTVEEQIFALGEVKLKLDERVAGAVEAVKAAEDEVAPTATAGEGKMSKADVEGAKKVSDMLLKSLEGDGNYNDNGNSSGSSIFSSTAATPADMSVVDDDDEECKAEDEKNKNRASGRRKTTGKMIITLNTKPRPKLDNNVSNKRDAAVKQGVTSTSTSTSTSSSPLSSAPSTPTIKTESSPSPRLKTKTKTETAKKGHVNVNVNGKRKDVKQEFLKGLRAKGLHVSTT